MTKRELIRTSIGTFALLAVTVLFFVNTAEVVPSGGTVVTLSFFLIGIISSYNLLRSNTHDGISLRVIFWFFSFLFFAFTPYLKYVTDGFQYPLNDFSILIANLLILVHLLIVHLAYSLHTSLTSRKYGRSVSVQPVVLTKISQWKLFLAAMLSFAIAGISIAKNGLTVEQLLGQRDEFSPAGQIVQFYLRPFTFFSFLFAVFCVRYKLGKRAFAYSLLILSAIPALLLNFPISTNRFYVFSIYFGLLIIVNPPSAKNRGLYLSLLFAGIIGSFFMVSLFRPSFGEGLFDISYLTGLTFDAYESFVYSIDYVAAKGVTWGRQLLGGLLFWIPREIWPNKPVGTGGLVIEAVHGASFTNVSAPLIEEAYINFWLFGIILYSWLIGWATGYFDGKYRWVGRQIQGSWVPRRADFYLIFYPVAVGFFLFALRGDFLSSFAYFTGMFCSFLTVRTIVVGRARTRIASEGLWFDTHSQEVR